MLGEAWDARLLLAWRTNCYGLQGMPQVWTWSLPESLGRMESNLAPLGRLFARFVANNVSSAAVFWKFLKCTDCGGPRNFTVGTSAVILLAASFWLHASGRSHLLQRLPRCVHWCLPKLREERHYLLTEAHWWNSLQTSLQGLCDKLSPRSLQIPSPLHCIAPLRMFPRYNRLAYGNRAIYLKKTLLIYEFAKATGPVQTTTQQ